MSKNKHNNTNFLVLLDLKMLRILLKTDHSKFEWEKECTMTFLSQVKKLGGEQLRNIYINKKDGTPKMDIEDISLPEIEAVIARKEKDLRDSLKRFNDTPNKTNLEK